MPKQSIRFGIDIDGTVTCPTSLLPHINEAFSCNLVLDDIKEYDLTAAFPVDRNAFYKWFKEAEPKIYETSPIQQHAKQVLDKWKKQHEVYFISARGENVWDVTVDWFKKEEVLYDHLILTGSHDKISAAKEHKIELFLEDKHDNAVTLHEELNIPVLLFNTPYNQEPIPDGVHRVNNWKEAEHWVDRFIITNAFPIK
ncbi:hypothetical protein [Paenisporosarcina cavernae]|uniref:Nucleotidase n=1 Tax=Paenisporosarcina cavernae TaxID=2320858 RepID=A0A385YTF0_9BACL|nr:hypothetical protein [Paenisporosarcina cavernae]AYC29590.1 hypothetical protein D3873_06715 [Paenisporosarcina cavernae]